MRRPPFFANCLRRGGGGLLFLGLTLAVRGGAPIQMGRPTPPPVRSANAQRPAQELIYRQEPPTISPRVLETMTPESASILVSLSKQRAYLMSGGQIAVDTPVSSGKRSRMTPKGSFKVLEKDKDHRSNVYGAFCDAQGRIVRAGVSTKIDAAPSGTHFVGAPMLYFLRLTGDGVGMHIGILPGYAASHGCVRLPAEIAPIFYAKTQVGTPAEIVD